jgi:CRP-like cAMP-binding protein
MTAILLQEFRNADIEWFQANGMIEKYRSQEYLLHPDRPPEQLYILLDGAFQLTMPHQESQNLQELSTLPMGDIVGLIPALESSFSDAIIHTETDATVIAINYHQLAEKLAIDSIFAAHFYRTQALLLIQRLQQLASQRQIHPSILYKLNTKESSSLLTELQDSDLDWFVAVGQIQQLSAQTALQLPYQPIDALYIILDGALSLSKPATEQSAISQAFLPSPTIESQELARIGRGDIFGELRFIPSSVHDLSVQAIHVQAERSTELLCIPYWRLASRLLHDPDFATRFYRTLAQLLANKYQTLVSKLGFVTSQAHQAFGDRFLARVSMAEARFELMMKRIDATHFSNNNNLARK